MLSVWRHSFWGYTSASIPECQFHDSVKRVARMGVCQTGVCQVNVVPVACGRSAVVVDGARRGTAPDKAACRSMATMFFAFQNQQKGTNRSAQWSETISVFGGQNSPGMIFDGSILAVFGDLCWYFGLVHGLSHKTIMMAQTRQQG